jgi:hypothetical protein
MCVPTLIRCDPALAPFQNEKAKGNLNEGREADCLSARREASEWLRVRLVRAMECF